MSNIQSKITRHAKNQDNKGKKHQLINTEPEITRDNGSRAPLVAQWLTIHLPVQGTRVRALVQEDPTCRGATKPVCHNY